MKPRDSKREKNWILPTLVAQQLAGSPWSPDEKGQLDKIIGQSWRVPAALYWICHLRMDEVKVNDGIEKEFGAGKLALIPKVPMLG
jgi:hypothetical protein